MSASFPVAVEGIGEFTFRKRRIRDQVAIEAEASRITGGPSKDGAVDAIAVAMATIQTLQIASPPGWDIEALDPFDVEQVGQIWRVFGALRAEEDRFRGKPGA